MYTPNVEERLARFKKEEIYRNNVYGAMSSNPYDKYINTLETMEVKMDEPHPELDNVVLTTICYVKKDDGTYLRTKKFDKSISEEQILDDLDMRGEFLYIQTSFRFGMVASIKINGEFIEEGF